MSADTDVEDMRAIRCEHCRAEGRIYREVSRHWGVDPETVDCGECPVCEGTCLELIETEQIELDDLCRNGGCQYAKGVDMPEYSCERNAP